MKKYLNADVDLNHSLPQAYFFYKAASSNDLEGIFQCARCLTSKTETLDYWNLKTDLHIFCWWLGSWGGG